jgi:hypothetical protein
VYLQQPDGRFPSLPSRKVEIKPEIIAFATADLRPEPGDELVFISSDAVYSFSSAIDSYSGNLQKLVDWPLIASTPERRQIPYLGALPDLNEDGHVDLLLPDEQGFGHFRGQGGEQFEFVNKVITVNGNLASLERRNRSAAGMNIRLSDAGVIDITVANPTSSEFSNFLREWRPDIPAGAGLLRKQDWIPTLALARVNDDKLDDLVFINETDDEQRQISLLLQGADGEFADVPDWQAQARSRSAWRLLDFTGDEKADLLRTDSEGNESTLYFYRNRAGSFNLETPDQVLRFSGLGLEIDFSDLDNDAKPELGVSYFSIPVLDALRNTSIQRTRLIFANIAGAGSAQTPEQNLLFSRRADYKLDESLSADNILSLTSFGNLQVDLDGDNRKDYLQIAGNGTLTAKAVNTNFQIETEAWWQYVPNHIVVGFTTEELNTDARPDIILRHSQHFTLLVSVE